MNNLKKPIVFWIYLVLMIGFMPLTPLLRSPAGQMSLRIGVPLLYGFVFFFSLRQLIRMIQRAQKRSHWRTVGFFILLWAWVIYSVIQAPYWVEKLHYVQYMVLYWIALRFCRAKGMNPHYVWAGVIGILVGTGDELVQLGLPERVFDVRDMLFNYQGVLFGFLLVIILGRIPQSETD